MTPRQIAAWLVRLLVLSLIVVLMVFGRLYCRSVDSYRQAEELFAQDKLRQAMIEYEAVITNYTPLFNGRVEQAGLRLLEIGKKFEEADSLIIAFRAYQSLTSGLTGIRSIYQPYPDLNRRGREELERVRKQVDEMDRSRWRAYEADGSPAGEK